MQNERRHVIRTKSKAKSPPVCEATFILHAIRNTQYASSCKALKMSVATNSRARTSYWWAMMSHEGVLPTVPEAEKERQGLFHCSEVESCAWSEACGDWVGFTHRCTWLVADRSYLAWQFRDTASIFGTLKVRVTIMWNIRSRAPGILSGLWPRFLMFSCCLRSCILDSYIVLPSARFPK